MVRVFVGSFLGRPSGEALQGRTYSVFFAVALASVFVNPAFANEWNLYDSARVATFYTNLNLKGQGSDEAGLITIKNTRWELQGNSRIGANVKGDTIDARFEYGAFDGDANIRLLYGVWKFTEGWGLKVGQDYTPITFFLSNQVYNDDNDLDQQGLAYGSWRVQVAIRGRGFDFAAIVPTSGQNADPDGNVAAVSVENYWPKLEAMSLPTA